MEGSSSPRVKRICVFGGAYPGRDDVFANEAIKLGVMLAQKKIQVSYGGGCSGLMGAVAAAACTGGSPVLGILPTFHSHLRGRSHGCEIQVWSLAERLDMMYHSAEAFIALPGGIGTLEEIASMASKATLVIRKKPICLLNINGYFDGLLSFLDHAVESGLMFSVARNVILSATTVEGVLEALGVHKPSPQVVMPPVRDGKDKGKGGVNCDLSL